MKGQPCFLAEGRILAWVVAALLSAEASTKSAQDPVYGRWTGPNDFNLSCPDCFYDEIGHATLIPTGEQKGNVLVWTRCDNVPNRPSGCGAYSSHILDPGSFSAVAHPSFSPALPGDPGAGIELDGRFCAGHAWILDASGEPKFLVAGGSYYDGTGPPPASNETFWFDPNASPPQWLDGPGTLPDLRAGDPGEALVVRKGSWYPSVLTFLDPVASRFRPMAIGGTTHQGDADPSDPFVDWWTMSLGGVWSVNADPNDTYRWLQYPRTVFATTPPVGGNVLGEVFAAGEDKVHNVVNPCQRINTAAVPQDHFAGPDPDVVNNDPTIAVGEWYYNNVVLMHTLKPTWTWTTDPDAALGQYDLNRVIGTMGAFQGSVNAPPIPDTLEYDSSFNPPVGRWTRKASAPLARAFSNAVVLPDATVLVVGGQHKFSTGDDVDTIYYKRADRFDPQGPADQGTWTQLASGPDTTPRGYHSAALLLTDGSVWLMGGEFDSRTGTFPDSEDNVDHYEPPYLFQPGPRPVLKNVPAEIHYGETFSICTRPGQASPGGGPIPIVRYCLIGVGSVTHHFDYGQRYVELLHHAGGGGCALFDLPVELLAPPKAAMAPEGYYLLFGVDSRGVPSVGKFVKLTF